MLPIPALKGLILGRIISSTWFLPKKRDGGWRACFTLVLALVYASCFDSKTFAVKFSGERLPIRRLPWDLGGLGEAPLEQTSSSQEVAPEALWSSLRGSTWQWWPPVMGVSLFSFLQQSPYFWHVCAEWCGHHVEAGAAAVPGQGHWDLCTPWFPWLPVVDSLSLLEPTS